MAPPRILLCGDVLGRLNQLFKRVQSVSKSAGPFDALLCVGQFFPDSPDGVDEFMGYMEGRVEFPIPTYFVGDYGVGAGKVLAKAAREGGNQGFKMDGLSVCEGLYWLKGSGKFDLHGLYVVYLSGRKSSASQQFGVYSQDDVDALHAIAEEPGIVDIFLTNEWPSGVTNRAATNELSPEVSGDLDSDSTVAELAAEIKPRYHIAGSKGIFYSREPYYNDGVVHVTRFIGLAAVGNKDKQKFIHAISPTPASMMTGVEISAKPTKTTLSPYSEDRRTNSKESVKRPVDNTVETQYWRYEVKKHRQGDGEQDKLCFKFLSSDCPRGEKCHFRHDPDAREQYKRGVCFDFLNKGRCDRGPDCQFEHKLLDESSKRRRPEGGSINRSKECWFCLSSPNVEADLIVSIGVHFYCALAKGPLVDDHVLVIPIEHLHSTLSAPPECERELHNFRSSLRLYSKNRGKETVFFELISKRGTHANLQAVPVPLTKASALKNIFIFAAKKLGFDFEVVHAKDNSDGKRLSTLQSESKFGFFYVELPDHTTLSHSIEEQENFPVQFGREVLAGLLKMPEKADWRNCKLSKEEELKLVETFKSQFELEQR